MPCSGVGCGSSAQPSLPASGVKPGGQGRPVRAERSEPRSGALYGRAKRSCLRPERVHVLEDPKELGSAATARTSGAAAPSHHPRKQHKRRFLLAPRCSEWVDLSSCVDQALGPLVAGRFAVPADDRSAHVAAHRMLLSAEPRVCRRFVGSGPMGTAAIESREPCRIRLSRPRCR